ncbi:hypothetical protein L7H23_16815 [Sphingopyxis sp. BSN-002]|uniref:hypothetical protein n=1 Tax=Sphingopyxis sp. BSN-002 TaxID=2911495 RepID=UPI001EDB9820|nr:hypothetical protein [Sphingopyxis sp. BSN-002]UKK84207.1 hypothetical protein L7H23_16815 [Sphingopyxis sp. BSN-002]
MRQLSEILEEERFEGRKPPTRVLTDMFFTTPPHATYVPGLCVVDRLTVSFTPHPKMAKPDADTPVRANGFSAERFYRFAQRPDAGYHQLLAEDYHPDDSRCSGALWKDEFFRAPSEEIAADGYFVAHRALDAILAGTPPFPFTCEKFPMETALGCSDLARMLKEGEIDSIDRCEESDATTAGNNCFAIRSGDRELRILASPHASGPNVPPPLTIASVHIGSLIVLVHERVD